MRRLAFDTHAFVKRLTAAGMPEQQAQVVADHQAALIDEKPATKADLAATERALRADLREVEFRLESKIETIKSELVKWMFGTIGFQTILILGGVIANLYFRYERAD